MKVINTLWQIFCFRAISILGYIIPIILFIVSSVIYMKTQGMQEKWASLAWIAYLFIPAFYIFIANISVLYFGSIEFVIRRNKLNKEIKCKHPYLFACGLILNLLFIMFSCCLLIVLNR